MANRKGVFIGAYVPNHLKESLRRRAAAEHRTLSQEITRILEEAVHGKGLPPGSVDRRNRESTPRRRATDPVPRRRKFQPGNSLEISCHCCAVCSPNSTSVFPDISLHTGLEENSGCREDYRRFAAKSG